MNAKILSAISFVAGAAISGVATYFITRRIERAKAEIYIQKQLDEDRKAMREKWDVVTTHEEDIRKDAVDEYCEEVREQRREMREIAKKYQTADPHPFAQLDPNSDEFREAIERTHIEQDNPYIILEDEHYDGQGYDLNYLFYHPDAGDVAGSDGILVDPDECIGKKIFEEFAADPDVDEIWVRNPFLMIDFNIVKEVVSR